MQFAQFGGSRGLGPCASWYEYPILGSEGILYRRGASLWMAIGCCLLGLLLVPAVAAADPPSFDAHGSVEQVYATGLQPGAQVSLYDSGDQEVASRTANPLGGTLFRNVTPGPGYTVRSGGEQSAPLE